MKNFINKMKHKTKAITSTVLAFALCFSVLGTTSLAAENESPETNDDNLPDYETTVTGSCDELYTVTISDVENGQVSFKDVEEDTAQFAAGYEVELDIVPDKGYQFEKVEVTDAENGKLQNEYNDPGTGLIVFTMPEKNLTVQAYFGDIDEESISALSAGDIKTLSQSQLRVREDSKIYPNSLPYFTFDPSSPDFSYTLGDNMGIATDVMDWSNSYINLDWEITTTIDSANGFSRTNPLSIKQENICTIGGRSVDMTLNITNISVGPLQGGETWAPSGHDGASGRAYQAGDTIGLAGIRHTTGGFEFYSYANAKVVYDWNVEMRWHDTNGLISIPFNLIISDIDMGADDMYYHESWTLPDSSYSTYDLYQGYTLDITYPSETTTKFASPENRNITDPDEEYRLVGVTAISNNGNFGGTTEVGGTIGSNLAVWSDLAPIEDPVKTVVDKQDVYATGDIVSYSVTQKMPEYMVDNFETYGSLAFIDAIPNGLTYVAGSARMYNGDKDHDITYSAGSFSYNDGTLRFEFNDQWLGTTSNYAGQDLIMTFECKVDEGADQTLTNSAYTNFSGVEYGPSEVIITIEDPNPSLSITKTTDHDTYAVGDIINYSIVVKETVDGAVSNNVVVTDTLPDGLTPVGAPTTSKGAVSMTGNELTANIGTLEYDETVTITVAAEVTDKALAGKSVTNTAYVTDDYRNEQGEDPLKSSVTVNILKPGISIDKSVSAGPYNAGDDITYTLVITETEDNLTTYDAVVTDTLPDGITAEDQTLTVSGVEGTASVSGNKVTANIPTLASGQKATIEVPAKINADANGSTIKNTAYVTDYYDNSDNDSATITVENPNVAIAKSVSDGPYNVGDTIEYTIAVTESVPNAIDYGVVITDPLPEGITAEDQEMTVDGVTGTASVSSNQITASIPTLKYGDTAIIKVQATIGEGTNGQTITNTAYVTDTYGNTGDDNAEITVLNPYVNIDKSVSDGPYNVGDNIEYTLIIKETTENAVDYDVVVTDSLPEGITADDQELEVSGVTGTASISNNEITANIPTLKYGETATITFEAKIGASAHGQEVVNTAYVTDRYGHDDDDDAKITVLDPNVSINKTVDPTTKRNVKDTITYTLVVEETEPDAVDYDVVVSDDIPEGLTVVEDSVKLEGVEGSAYMDGGTLKAEIPVLKYGDKATITVQAVIGASLRGETIHNVAVVTDTYENHDENDADVEVLAPDINIAKSVNSGPYNVGDVALYTLKITQPIADAIAFDVVVEDELPDGLTATGNASIEGVDGAEVHVNGNGYEATIPELKYGETVTVEVETTIDASAVGTTIDNVADVTDSYDDYDTSNVPIEVLQPTLSITKRADGTAYSVDDIVTYTIVVNQTTDGAVARNVVVSDTIPEELEIISVESDRGEASTSGNSFTVNCGDMWITDTATITVTAKALTEKEDIVNTAYTKADYTEEVSDDWTINIRRPGLNIYKDADGEKYYPGDTVVYDIRVQNLKENEDDEGDVPTAYNVVVSDVLPEGLTLVGVTADNDGAVETEDNAFTVTWPYMYYGDEFAIQVTATVNDDMDNTSLTNIATVTSDTTDPLDDYAEIEVIKPHLNIEKDADKSIYSIDGQVIYTIDVTQTIENLTAENLVITDTLPDEMELIDVELSGIEGEVAIDGNSFTINAPALAFGETATVTVTAKAVADGEEVVNIAYADADHADPVDDDVTVTVLQPVLGIEKNVDQTRHYVGDEVVYTIVASELIEDAEAYNVVVSDTLPEGLELTDVSLNDIEGEIETDSNSFTVTYDMIDSVNAAIITVKANALEEAANTTLNNVATAVADNAEEVSDDADVLIMQPELAIEKTSDKETYDVNETATFTITVSETVEDISETNVVIWDELPEGLTISGTPELSGTEGEVSVDGNTVTVNVPELVYGNDAVVTIKATVGEDLAGQSVDNVAFATGDHTDDISDDAEIKVNTPAVTETPTETPTSTPTSETPSETSSNVQTGDTYMMYALLAIAAILLIGGAVLVMRRRKN